MRKCGKGFIVGECCKGHKWAKRIYCMREDCEICGKKGGELQKRRINRSLPNYIIMINEGPIGFLVITFPDEYRESLKCKKFLGKTRRYSIRKLTREWKVRGISVWHWASERNPGKYHPHLNFLISGGIVKINNGYIMKEVLKKFRKDFMRRFKLENIVIKYHYLTNSKEKMGKLRYVLRPTFSSQDEMDYEQIKGYKNIVWFGTFPKNKSKKINNLEYGEKATKMFNRQKCNGECTMRWIFGRGIDCKKCEDKRLSQWYLLAHGICPFCLNRIRWRRGDVKEDELKRLVTRMKEIEGGFYYIEVESTRWENYKRIIELLRTNRKMDESVSSSIYVRSDSTISPTAQPPADMASNVLS